MSLHQLASLIKSVNPVARSMRAHSSLIRQARQDGELFAIHCAVLRSYRHIDRHVKSSSPPAYEPRTIPCLIPSLYARRVESVGQDVPVGPPDRPETGPWSASTPYGWWVSSFLFFLGVWDPFFFFPYTFFEFFFFIEVFKGFEFLRTVLWPVHLCLCPRRARLNWAARFWVPTCSC